MLLSGKITARDSNSSSASWQRRRWHPTPVLCLENPMDGGAWWAAVHGVARSRTLLSAFTFTFHFHALEKEMATHSSVLAWRIPGTGEPGGLPSMGSHRVGHSWSDLAAAVAQGENLQVTHGLSPPPWEASAWDASDWIRKVPKFTFAGNTQPHPQ